MVTEGRRARAQGRLVMAGRLPRRDQTPQQHARGRHKIRTTPHTTKASLSQIAPRFSDRQNYVLNGASGALLSGFCFFALQWRSKAQGGGGAKPRASRFLVGLRWVWP